MHEKAWDTKTSDTTHVMLPNLECGLCFPETSDAWNVIHWNVNNNSCPLDSLIELFCSRSEHSAAYHISAPLFRDHYSVTWPKVFFCLMTKTDGGFLEVNNSEVDQWIQAPHNRSQSMTQKQICCLFFPVFSVKLIFLYSSCSLPRMRSQLLCLLDVYFENSMPLIYAGIVPWIYSFSNSIKLLLFCKCAVLYREKEIKLTGPMFDFVHPKLLDSWKNAIETWFKI